MATTFPVRASAGLKARCLATSADRRVLYRPGTESALAS